MKKAKTLFRPLDGILLLDKPQGISSNQALQQARHLFRAEKGGHTGSLDPLATGLLPLCFGEATKIAGLLLGSAKAYETTAVLGLTTDSDDADGAPLLERPVPVLDDAMIEASWIDRDHFEPTAQQRECGASGGGTDLHRDVTGLHRCTGPRERLFELGEGA